ncbi:MAG: hypothetical protein Q9214_000852 [Letrouitia sp. 1 TL-2023]
MTSKLHDFDQPSNYETILRAILRRETYNVLVDFDSKSVHAAVDLCKNDIKEILEAPEGRLRTKWITIFGPERQTELVKSLASRYGFSPRLLGLMCTPPPEPSIRKANPPKSLPLLTDQNYPCKRTTPQASESHFSDLEGGMELAASHVGKMRSLNLNLYTLVSKAWHFCSVDWGTKYLCVGYNSVHDTHNQAQTSDDSNLDSTIISMHETPPLTVEGMPPSDELSMPILRRNLTNVFRQLSKADDPERVTNPMMTLPIRSGPQALNGEDISNSDAPCLLFYYLFDDWFTTYSLVAREEHQYRAQLEKLRTEMFSKPEVEHIKTLHIIGLQLGVLKRIYQSYILIIERILDRQRPLKTRGSAFLNQNSTNAEQEQDSSFYVAAEVMVSSTQTFEVPLSSTATVRFERLRDRIKLYALSEIQECLDEKESLVFLNPTQSKD